MIGVPLGRNLISGATLCADPISWFQEREPDPQPELLHPRQARASANRALLSPHVARARRATACCRCSSATSSPTTSTSIEALGGQVFRLGRGRDYMNVLDPRRGDRRAQRPVDRARPASEVRADARARRLTMVATLITIARGSRSNRPGGDDPRPGTRVLDERHAGRPGAAAIWSSVIERARSELRAGRDGSRRRDPLSGHHREPAGLAARPDRAWPAGGDLLPAVDGRRCAATAGACSTSRRSTTARPRCWRASLVVCWSIGFGAINIAQGPRRRRP